MLNSCQMTTIELADYLQRELDQRGWSQAELADKAKLDPGIISRALNRGRMPSVESLVAIANALGVRPERVMIGAGIFPPDPTHNPDLLTEKIVHLVSQMDEIDKSNVLDYADLVLRRRKQRSLIDEFVARLSEIPKDQAASPLPDLDIDALVREGLGILEQGSFRQKQLFLRSFIREIRVELVNGEFVGGIDLILPGGDGVSVPL